MNPLVEIPIGTNFILFTFRVAKTEIVPSGSEFVSGVPER
jgi:hypothetical protein